VQALLGAGRNRRRPPGYGLVPPRSLSQMRRFGPGRMSSKDYVNPIRKRVGPLNWLVTFFRLLLEKARLPATEKPLEVTIFRTSGCHLCVTLEAEVRSIIAIGTNLVLVNIDENRELYDRYWLQVPVVRVRGKDVFEAKMMDQRGEWKMRLKGLIRENHEA